MAFRPPSRIETHFASNLFIFRHQLAYRARPTVSGHRISGVYHGVENAAYRPFLPFRNLFRAAGAGRKTARHLVSGPRPDTYTPAIGSIKQIPVRQVTAGRIWTSDTHVGLLLAKADQDLAGITSSSA